MTSWTETDARSSLRGEETVEGTPTYAIEEVPQRQDIGYKKIVVWLGHDDLVPRRLELYEDAAEPKKRIAQSDVKSIGAIPVPHHLEVATPAAGSHTVVEIADVQFNQKLDPDLFTQRYLERGGRWERNPRLPCTGAGAPSPLRFGAAGQGSGSDQAVRRLIGAPTAPPLPCCAVTDRGFPVRAARGLGV